MRLMAGTIGLVLSHTLVAEGIPLELYSVHAPRKADLMVKEQLLLYSVKRRS